MGAFEEKRRFGGEVPRAFRYVCPYCMRGVTPAAFDTRAEVEPHFKYKRNDSLVKFYEKIFTNILTELFKFDKYICKICLIRFR